MLKPSTTRHFTLITAPSLYLIAALKKCFIHCFVYLFIYCQQFFAQIFEMYIFYSLYADYTVWKCPPTPFHCIFSSVFLCKWQRALSLGKWSLPLEPLSFHLNLLSSVCRVQVERKLTSSAVMWARLHCRPLELSFQRLLLTNYNHFILIVPLFFLY